MKSIIKIHHVVHTCACHVNKDFPQNCVMDHVAVEKPCRASYKLIGPWEEIRNYLSIFKCSWAGECLFTCSGKSRWDSSCFWTDYLLHFFLTIYVKIADLFRTFMFSIDHIYISVTIWVKVNKYLKRKEVKHLYRIFSFRSILINSHWFALLGHLQ